MSTEPADKKTPLPGTPVLETGVAKQQVTSFEDGKAKSTTEDAATWQDGDDKAGLSDEDKAALEVVDDEGTDGGEGSDTDDKAEDTDTADDLPDLGEWDPTNDEVVAKFDEAYIKDGKLDLTGALSREFWATYDPKAPEKSGLKEATYKYLEDQFGLSKDDVKQVEAGQLARAEREREAFFSSVGGQAKYDAALDWGRKNYTEAQQKRFVEARNKGGADFTDAVDALMARYARANPEQTQGRGPRFRQRRPSTPTRDVTGGASGGQASRDRGDVFKSTKEFQDAMAAARKEGDQSKIDAIRAKGKRSRF